MKYFFGVFWGLLVIAYYAELKVNLTLWVFLACLIILTILLCIWIYKIFKKNIDSIIDSLDELKELKEE